MTRRDRGFEYYFSLLAILTFCGGLNPLFYTLLGSNSESFTDSNPLKLGLSLAIYGIASLLFLYRIKMARWVLATNWPLLALSALPLLSVLWSVDSAVSLKRAIAHLLTVGTCLYLVSTMSPEELFRRVMTTLFWAGLASFAYTAVNPADTIHRSGELAGSWKGIFGHKVELGRISSIAVISALFTVPTSRLMGWMRWGTVGMYLVLVVLAQSRTNWVVLLAMLAILPLNSWLANPRISPGIRIAGFTSAIAVMGFAITSGSDMLLTAIGRDPTFSGRTTLWHAISSVTEAKYPLLGAGFWAFFTPAGALSDLQPYLSHRTGIPNHAHNSFLNTQAMLGLVGLVVLVAFLVLTAVRLIRCVMAQPDRKIWSGWIAMLFFFLVESFAASPAFRYGDISWILVLTAFGYAGLALAPAGATAKTSRRLFARRRTNPWVTQ